MADSITISAAHWARVAISLRQRLIVVDQVFVD